MEDVNYRQKQLGLGWNELERDRLKVRIGNMKVRIDSFRVRMGKPR